MDKEYDADDLIDEEENIEKSWDRLKLIEGTENIWGLTLSQILWMKRYFDERLIEIEEIKNAI